MASTEIAVPQSAAVEAMIADLNAKVGLDVQDGTAIGNALAERILSATTLDDIFKVSGLEAGKNWLDKPIVVNSVHWNESHFEEGFGFYAVLDAVDPETGETAVIGTSARQSCAQLYAVGRMDAFPITVIIRQATRPSKAGFRAQWLELVR